MLSEKENLSNRVHTTGFNQKKPVPPIGEHALREGPILLCQPSGQPLMIGFGCVKVKDEAERIVNVFNPGRSTAAEVCVPPSAVHGELKATFSGGSLRSYIEPMKSEPLFLRWKPSNAVSLTESIELKLNASSTLTLTVTGISAQAEVPVMHKSKHDNLARRAFDIIPLDESKQSAAVRKEGPLANSTASDNMKEAFLPSEPMVLVPRQKSAVAAPSKIDFGSVTGMIGKSSVESKPSSKKAKLGSLMQIHHTKQIESMFTQWLNFMLSVSGDDKIPSDEPEHLSHKRLVARQRQAVIELYNSDEFSNTVDSLMKEVFDKQLQIREDRDIISDVGLRESFFDLLLNYDSPWLKVCLEVVCGESVTQFYNDKMQKNNVEPDRKYSVGVEDCNPSKLANKSKVNLKQQLKYFVAEKVIDDAIVRERFGGPSSYVQERRLKIELCQYTVCKFFSLVLLLDQARLKRLIQNPLLFHRSAKIKSSKGILIEFCKTFLKGEGDIIRHLSMLGYEVKYVQNYLDEFDYTVSNLAVDLRDGVRLAKLADMLTGCKTNLADHLRVPAISRLQKLHNVQYALQYLNARVSGDKTTLFDVLLDAKSVVDGNRDETLVVLWKLICGHEVPADLNAEIIKKEAKRIESIKNVGDRSSDIIGNIDISVPLTDPLFNIYQSVARWCNAVIYPSLPLHDFTTCFADNKVLCLLINYYQPHILPRESIKGCLLDCSMSIIKAGPSQFDGRSVTYPAEGTETKSEKCTIKMERENYALFTRACRTLGGVPMLFNSCDSKSVPEEKTVLYSLILLFKRLMEMRCEHQSSIKIQRCFRNFSKTKMLRKSLHKRRQTARIGNKRAVSHARLRHFPDSNLSIRRLGLQRHVNSQDHEEVTINISERNLALCKIRRWMSKWCYKKKAKTINQYKAKGHEFHIDAYSNLGPTDVLKSSQLDVHTDKIEITQLTSWERTQLTVDPVGKQEWQHETEKALARECIEKRRDQEIEELKKLYNNELSTRKLMEDTMIFAETEKRRMWQAHQEAVAECNRRAQLALEAALSRHEQEETSIIMKANIALQEERTMRLALEKELRDMLVSQEVAKLRVKELEEERSLMETEAQRKIRCKEIKKTSATRIQRFFRKSIALKRTRSKIRSALRIQSQIRRMLAVRDIHKIKSAVKTIQQYYRLLLRKRKEFFNQNDSCLRIQKMWRGILCRIHYVGLLAKNNSQKQLCAVRIQRWWKIIMLRTKNAKKTLASSLIQRKVFEYVSRKWANRRKMAAYLIFKSWKNFSVRKAFLRSRIETKRLLTLQEHAAKVVYRFIREVINKKVQIRAVATISRWMIAYQPVLRVRLMLKGFSRLQAFYRAYKIRLRSAASVKMARRKIQLAESNSQLNPSQQLGCLTKNALKTLKKGKMISQVFKACHVLDTATKYSVNCCVAFANAGATKALLNLIRSCNRSTPHQEILRYSVSILLNVVRHPNLALMVAVDFDGTDVVVDLMQMFRDKSVIFNQSCELLSYMVCASDVIKMLCNQPDLRKRLDGILHIMARKSRLDARLQRVVTQKSNKNVARNLFGELDKSSTVLMENLICLLNSA